VRSRRGRYERGDRRLQSPPPSGFLAFRATPALPDRSASSLPVTKKAVAVNGTKKVLAWLRDRGEILDGLPSSASRPRPLRSADMIKIGRRGQHDRPAHRRGRSGPRRLFRHLTDNAAHRLVALLQGADLEARSIPATEHFSAVQPPGDDDRYRQSGDQCPVPGSRPRHPSTSASTTGGRADTLKSWVADRLAAFWRQVSGGLGGQRRNRFLVPPGPGSATASARRSAAVDRPCPRAQHHRRHFRRRALSTRIARSPNSASWALTMHKADERVENRRHRPADRDLRGLPRAVSSAQA